MTFYLDGRRSATEQFQPWDLLGGRRLDPKDVTPGVHTVRAEITFSDRTTSLRSATFTTLNR